MHASLNDVRLGNLGGESALRVGYRSAAELKRLCNALGIMEDLKAGVPRTAYRGVITLRLGGRRAHPRASQPSDSQPPQPAASHPPATSQPASRQPATRQPATRLPTARAHAP